MAGINRTRINLGRRTQQQTDTKDSTGGVKRVGFMNYRDCALKFFKLADVGKIQDINILPWKIATPNHPEVVAGNMEVGDYDYVLDIWVHQKIGPEEVDFVCPKKSLGKYCPCCEEADNLWNEGTEESKAAARPLFARRRCVYQVQELDEDFHAVSEEPKIFEVAHQNFSKDLQGKASSCMRGKGVVNFANVDDDGRVVSFEVGEESMGKGRTYKIAKNFEFNARVEEVSDEILEKCVSLDAMMVLKTPQQIKDIMFGTGDGGQDEQDGPSEDTPSHDDHHSEPAHRSRTLSNDKGEDFDDPFPDQPTNLRRGRRPAEDAVDDGVEDAPSEPRKAPEKAQEPARQARRAPREEESRGGDNPCPNGYQFGADCDRKALCYKCPEAIYNRCLKASGR